MEALNRTRRVFVHSCYVSRLIEFS